MARSRRVLRTTVGQSDFLLGPMKGFSRGVMWRGDREDKAGNEDGKAGLVQCLTRGKHSWYLLSKWMLKGTIYDKGKIGPQTKIGGRKKNACLQ